MEFIASMRCDRCGARAAHKATKPGLSELLFCNHHYTENRDALIKQYWLIESENMTPVVQEPVYTD